jgi:hypothetical protein
MLHRSDWRRLDLIEIPRSRRLMSEFHSFVAAGVLRGAEDKPGGF